MDIELGDSDANLWAAAVRGDAAAFGSVFDRHYRPVLAHCSRIAADRASAEDVASMVFLQAWRLRAKVVLDPDQSIRPWLFAIATNVSSNTNRAYRRYGTFLAKLPPAGTDESAETTVTERIYRTEQNSRMAAAIAALPPESREVVELCDLQRLAHHEVASRLGMSVRTLRRRLTTARSQIREVLSSDPPAPRFRQVATVPQGRDVP